ncbi:9593_t:CDS:2, partial [Racocetra fulgida]
MTNSATSNFIKESFIIVTGGDDNAITALVLAFTYHEVKEMDCGIKRGKWTVEQCINDVLKMDIAHGSSIQGRLNLWNITFSNLFNNKINKNDESKFELIKSEFINVCDPCCMDVLKINSRNDKTKLMVAI